ncbi:AAA family ATPase [Acanthopleuribacter pedis]|uniref:AAA family ATPase n=1 Tax=Acanthopleuribacter pedis TaxID=442870 RepID=A0A8J7QC04_9BACT|nr:AAA family ATPase [Acanthopleuribacter pedis]MBO1321657.1 AAA family ATPase [Acanthopleuribacter pedis]
MREVLKRYQKSSELLRSNHFALYRAWEKVGRESVLLKIPLSPRPGSHEIALLEQEYEMTRNLDVDGVLRARELLRFSPAFALVFDDPGGMPLKNVIADHRFDLARFLPFSGSLAQTIGALHQRGVIHKNISPETIWYDSRSGRGYLMGFQIASTFTTEAKEGWAANWFEDSLPYISPEQTGRMNRLLDYRTDFYSLGVSFYEALCGRPPFQQRDAMELIHSHLAKVPPPLEQQNQEVPGPVAQIIHKLMAKAAEDRYQSGAGLLFDLTDCAARLQHQKGRPTDFTLGRKDVSEWLYLPQKLYGRTPELDELLHWFDTMDQFRNPLLLVTGYAGIGKSALIRELYKPITLRQGFFAAGKFDQLNKNEPYSAILQALGRLLKQFLTLADAELNHWRDKINAALGGEGGVLTPVLPELSLVIGEQAEVPELAPAEAKFRFATVCVKLLGALAQAAHPLVLFLDDLQWADSASLDLLAHFTTAEEVSWLMVIGAYRDNEVPPAHPLNTTLEQITDVSGQAPRHIRLQPLSADSVNQLVADTLRRDPFETRDLSAFVRQKTGGNPFFVRQLLLAVHRRRFLRLDTQRTWVWDLEQIRQMAITDNVVDLMIAKITNLAPEAARTLQLAAFFGNQFSLELLADLRDKDLRAVAKDLMSPVRDGLLVVLNDQYDTLMKSQLPLCGATVENLGAVDFRFVHDRVQQAAYFSIDPDESTVLHYRIGRLFLARHQQGTHAGTLFEIVTHLNIGQAFLAADQKRRLLDLNVEAGVKAKASGAYDTALELLETAESLLPPDAWETRFAFTFDLSYNLAETLFLLSQLEQADVLLKNLLTRAHDPIARAKIYQQRNLIDLAGANFQGIEDQTLASLIDLGIDFPTDRALITTRIEAEFQLLQEDLTRWSLDDWVTRPLNEDMKVHYQIAGFCSLANVAAWIFVDHDRATLAVLMGCRLAVKHGPDEPASLIMALAVLCLGPRFGDYALGHRFLQAAYETTAHHDLAGARSRVCELFGGFGHLGLPLQACIPIMVEGFRRGLEGGDINYTIYNCKGKMPLRFYHGDPLGDIQEKCRHYHEHFAKLGFSEQLMAFTAYAYAVQLLSEPETVATWLSETGLTEEGIIHGLEMTEIGFSVHACLVMIAFAHFLMGRADQAQAVLARYGEPDVWVKDSFYYAERLILEALIAADLAGPGCEATLTRLAEILETLDGYVALAPENYRIKRALIAGERHRLAGDLIAAEDAFQDAVAEAREAGRPYLVAMGNELTANLFRRRGRDKVAAVFAGDALIAYRAWGAHGKAAQLEAAHNDGLVPAGYGARERREAELDWESFIKAGQAVSDEIMLPVLMEKLMTYVMENAGAERCLLLRYRDRQLLLEAEALGDAGTVNLLSAAPVRYGQDVPESVVRYVARTRNSVVMADAAEDEQFAFDPYIAERRSKSMLCMPLLHQTDLVGMLFLENNLSRAVFTRERLKVLRILTAQAAISLENARLYSELENYSKTLEQKVAARTEVLHQQNLDLEMLDRIVGAINREVEVGAMLNALLQQGMNLFPRADWAVVYMRAFGREDFVFQTGFRVDEETFRKHRFTYSDLVACFQSNATRLDHGVFLTRAGVAGAETTTIAIFINLDEELPAVALWQSDQGADAFDAVGVDRISRFRQHVISAIIRSMDRRQLKRNNENILSSMRYARHIQSSMLVAREELTRLLPRHFLLFQPREMVSGDFYWLHETPRYLFVVVADCTGHGVPGALMTMIGVTQLNRIIVEMGGEEPAHILTELSEGVRRSLRQDSESLAADDGMELGLCRFEPATRELVFAGARRPLLWQAAGGGEAGGALQTIRGDRKGIGGRRRRSAAVYHNHRVQLATGDRVFMTTDGFVDQVNEAGKKFGNPALRERLANLPNIDQNSGDSHLLEPLRAFQGRAPQRDDMTILGFEVP